MKTVQKSLLTLVFFFIGCILIAGNPGINKENANVQSKIDDTDDSIAQALATITINQFDTVVFDLSKVVTAGSYISIPVSVLSDDDIHGLDFSLQFNESILTFDSIIDQTTYLDQLSHFAPDDHTLRFGSNSTTFYEKNKTLVYIRFLFTSVCNLKTVDFFNIKAYLNGYACSFKLTNALQYTPIANFTNSKLCIGSGNTFNNASILTGGTISSWLWIFGNGNTSTIENPSTSYANTGGKIITLIVASDLGCKDTVSKSMMVNSSPVTNFTSLSDCKTAAVKFTDNSTIPSGTIKGWTWNFGDTGFSSLPNPSHSYTSGGNYTVSLTVVSDSGCTSIFANTVFLNTPTAKFTTGKRCANSTVNFTDNSTVPSGTITGWSWYFGDGTSSIQQSPSHIYAIAGSYIVSLKITTSQNCSDSIAKSITIENKPIVKFGSDNVSGCMPLNVIFSDSSVATPDSKYFWNFGNTDTSSSKNVAHVYKTGGIYTVKQIVITAAGCSDSLIKSNYIRVYNTPVAKFITPNGCTGSTINFSDSSTISSGTITGWKWYFGEGTTGTLQHPSHTYITAGTYMVSLKITTNQNCSDSISKTVTIENKPTVKFGGDNVSGCAPLNVNFSDSSITTIGSKYFWSFGDTISSSLKNIAHAYMTTGVYTVKHTVITSAGCTDSLVKTGYINVIGTAIAKFTTANGCKGSTISFTDSSTISSGTITDWSWNFGDGTSSTLQSPSHIYVISGTYTVSLKITTSQKCSNSISKTITIENKPTVKFGSDNVSGCAPLNINFSDSSVAAPGSKYFWSFGDTGASASKNTAHAYVASGVYTVKHIVITSAGCIDSLVKTDYVKVTDAPAAKFTPSPYMTKLPNAIVDFTNHSSGSGALLWNFGDSTLSIQQSPAHTFVKAGIYTVCLMVQYITGCSSRYCDTITVNGPNVIAIPRAFSPNGDNINDLLLVRGGPMAEMELRIFNEWGNQVFLSTHQSEGWDGNFQGTPQMSGLFEYALKGKTADNQDINMHGVVNLVR